MFFDYISIPEKYIGLVIGKGGRTIRKIEIKHDVKIVVDKNVFIIYTPGEKNNITKAKNHMTEIYTKKILQEETCPICLDSISIEKNFVVTECGHRFHHSCLNESLKNCNNCPICRTEIVEKKEIDIEKIVFQTINRVRRSNYILNLEYYNIDMYNFQLVMEEFLKQPIRYALELVK